MEIGTAEVGMRVIISRSIGGKNSDVTQGWSSGMDEFLGTQQTISWVSDNGASIRFNSADYYWDPRDANELEPITDPITMAGKKETFDVNELQS